MVGARQTSLRVRLRPGGLQVRVALRAGAVPDVGQPGGSLVLEVAVRAAGGGRMAILEPDKTRRVPVMRGRVVADEAGLIQPLLPELRIGIPQRPGRRV